MYQKIIFLTSFFLFQMVFSQNSESIYYNKEWKETTKANASFYREMPLKKLGELVLIRDFYINGTPQFEGYAAQNDERAYVGDIVWYEEDGNDSTFRQYVNKSKNPMLTYYHANGKIRKTVQYKNGLKEGETTIYGLDGTVLMKGIYSKGKPSSGDFEIITEDYENNNSEEPALQKALYAEPQMSTSSRTAPKKINGATIKEKIFWINSNKLAQEKTYIVGKYKPELIEQKNYDLAGKLIQTILSNNFEEYSRRIRTGNEFEYYLQNNFATGLQSITNFVKGEKSGKSISYYSKGAQLSESNYREGLKDGEELTFNENGTVKNNRTYKENNPFNGNFEEKIGAFSLTTNYVNGEKEGESLATSEEKETVAKGIYKNGKPFTGTFITNDNTNDKNELINVENFKKTGLQKVFNYRLDHPEKTYTIQNEKLNGPTNFYDDEGKVIATIDYKNDEPYNGTLIGKKEATMYKNGKIETETIYKDEYSKKESNISKKKIYEDGILSKILDYSFKIEEKPQAFYEGILKNGKPFSGYFVTDEDSEFKEIDFYENGMPKFQYSNNYLENMDNYRYQSYNIKSTYKDGKIFDGVEYLLNNRQFISKNLKNGVLQSFDWDLFAENYFNRIHFELKNNTIEISDLQAKKKALIKIDQSKATVKKELLIDGKLVDSKSNTSAGKKSSASMILYYQENEKIISKIHETINEPIEPSEGDDLFYRVYLSMTDYSASMQEIFNQLPDKIAGNKLFKEDKEDEIITALRTDVTGKPEIGVLITPTENNTYNLKLYLNGKMLKNLDKIKFTEVQAAVKNLEKDL